VSPVEQDARRAWFRREILPLEPELRAYARRLAHDDARAEDLLHDAFARIIAVETWREVDSPAAFATRTLRNVAYDLARRQKVVAIDFVADLEVFGLADTGPDPEAALVARDELRRLRAIVERLPEQCRRVFTLRKVYDLPPGAIAERLGLSVSTVEKHLVKAVRLCAEALARDDAPAPDDRKKGSWPSLLDLSGKR
jgi:RNA polymerase sigma-70 factor (ECF subfamily)